MKSSSFKKITRTILIAIIFLVMLFLIGSIPLDSNKLSIITCFLVAFIWFVNSQVVKPAKEITHFLACARAVVTAIAQEYDESEIKLRAAITDTVHLCHTNRVDEKQATLINRDPKLRSLILVSYQRKDYFLFAIAVFLSYEQEMYAPEDKIRREVEAHFAERLDRFKGRCESYSSDLDKEIIPWTKYVTSPFGKDQREWSI